MADDPSSLWNYVNENSIVKGLPTSMNCAFSGQWMMTSKSVTRLL